MEQTPRPIHWSTASGAAFPAFSCLRTLEETAQIKFLLALPVPAEVMTIIPRRKDAIQKCVAAPEEMLDKNHKALDPPEDPMIQKCTFAKLSPVTILFCPFICCEIVQLITGHKASHFLTPHWAPVKFQSRTTMKDCRRRHCCVSALAFLCLQLAPFEGNLRDKALKHLLSEWSQGCDTQSLGAALPAWHPPRAQ